MSYESSLESLRRLAKLFCSDQCSVRAHRHECEAADDAIMELATHECKGACTEVHMPRGMADEAHAYEARVKLFGPDPVADKVLAGLNALVSAADPDDVIFIARVNAAVQWILANANGTGKQQARE